MVMEKCPKCGSLRIWSGKASAFTSGVLIFVPDNTAKIKTSVVYSKSWACKDCGYLETYVDKEELAKLEKKYSK